MYIIIWYIISYFYLILYHMYYIIYHIQYPKTPENIRKPQTPTHPKMYTRGAWNVQPKRLGCTFQRLGPYKRRPSRDHTIPWIGRKNGNGIRRLSFPPDTPHFNVDGSSTPLLRWWASCNTINIEMGVARGTGKRQSNGWFANAILFQKLADYRFFLPSMDPYSGSFLFDLRP